MQEHRAAAAATGSRRVVADIVQPPPELETAVEAVLGERLGNVIVESHEAGVEAIQFLKRSARGDRPSSRARCARPASAARRGRVRRHGAAGRRDAADAGFVPVVDADAIAAAWPKGDGVRGPMLELIGYDRQYDEVAAYLLGDVLVVEDLERALALWRETRPTKTIVTLEGEVIDPHGVVTGGSRESARRGRAGAEARDPRAGGDDGARSTPTRGGAGAAVERKQAAAELGARAGRGGGGAAQRRDGAVRAREGPRSRAARSCSALRDAARAAGRARRRARARRPTRTSGGSRRRAAGLESDARAAEERRGARRRAARAHRRRSADAVDAAIGELTTLKVAATQAEERRQNARETLERLAPIEPSEEARAARLEATLADDDARAATLRAGRGPAARRGGAVAGRGRGAGARPRRAAGRARGAQARAGRARRRSCARRAPRSPGWRRRCRGSSCAARRSRCAGPRWRSTSPSATATSSWASVVHDYHLRPLFGAEEEQRATELRGLIERMGEINLTAIEESEELQKRFDFLTDAEGGPRVARSRSSRRRSRRSTGPRGERFRETFDAVNAAVPGGVPAPVRRRARQPVADRRERHARDRHRDHRQPAGQEGQPEHRAAVGRREGADRGVAAVRDLPGQAVAVLHAGRGRRAARRGQRRPLQPGGARDDRPVAVHPHHAQPAHDGDRRPAVRHHHGRARRLASWWRSTCRGGKAGRIGRARDRDASAPSADSQSA